MVMYLGKRNVKGLFASKILYIDAFVINRILIVLFSKFPFVANAVRWGGTMALWVKPIPPFYGNGY